MAGNRYGVGSSFAFDEANALTDTFADAAWTTIFLVNDYLFALTAVAMRVEGMEDAVGCFLKTVAERVVATLVVVIAHFSGWIDGGFGFDFYFFDFFAGMGAVTLVLDVVGWLDASAVIAFSDVDFLLVAGSFDVDFGLAEALIAGFTIALRLVSFEFVLLENDKFLGCSRRGVQEFHRVMCLGSDHMVDVHK